jgi:cytochrome c biogenesis protein
MRFAISLLTVICIASVIGTVVKQHEPAVNYVNQFGPFWAEVFGALGCTRSTARWWFLLILAFLVISTSLCIARNTPKILPTCALQGEHARTGLAAFHHKAAGRIGAEPPDAAAARASASCWPPAAGRPSKPRSGPPARH